MLYFLLTLWSGSDPDVEITRNCALIHQPQRGYAFIIDKGFVNIANDFEI